MVFLYKSELQENNIIILQIIDGMVVNSPSLDKKLKLV